tara:strand:+ start:440 stop:697 length:258 start_codon:yes stop_codon:yes gene_type:complete
MEQEAIYILYPTVKQIIQEDETFKCLDENGSEVSIDMSAVNTKATELQAEADAEKQAKEDTKANAKAKLVAGEALTEDEANTIVL